MAGRTPSFIVVGLVIIMFLLGVFYMSCSSKNAELRTSLDQFEERIRALTLKNSDADKKYENLLTRQRELDEEKLTIQKQIEKKDSEINDLNTKLNEKLAELQSANSDKKVADEQIKEYKSQSDTLASKNSLIEKLQQQLNEQKQTYDVQINQLKKELEIVKLNTPAQNNQLSADNETKNTFMIPPQRFRPFETQNSTSRTIASLFQNPSNNLTKEIKPQMMPAVGGADIKDKAFNAFGMNANLTTTPIINQEQQKQAVGQNVPVPPLADNAQRQRQIDRVESAQAAPQLVNDRKAAAAAAANNAQYQNNLHRLLTNSIFDNKNVKLPNMEEIDDEQQQQQQRQLDADFVRQNKLDSNLPSHRRFDRKNYRLDHRDNIQSNRNRFRQRQRLDNGEELDDEIDRNDYRQMRKRNTV